MKVHYVWVTEYGDESCEAPVVIGHLKKILIVNL